MAESFEQLIAQRLLLTQQDREAMPKTAVQKETEITDRSLAKREDRGELTEPDFVRMEKNIAAFGFFTPSSKRIKNVPKIIRFTQTIDGNRVEARVKILGNIEYGMPVTADQDKYLAFQKIIERVKREQGTVTNPIAFTTTELIKLLGKSRAGHHYKEVEEWLKVMKGTVIESEGAVWIAGKKKFASDVFSLFDRAKKIGDELDDGSIADRNYVWLSSWYLENLNAHYLLPIDFETYKQLTNHVAKALVPLLQIWLYASREQGSFEKRYSELCQTLNIAEYRYLSKIREKLAPSLNELIEYGYLDSWTVEKTSDKKDFKIIFRHGWKFYSDRKLSKLSPKKRAAKFAALKGENVPTQPNIPAEEKDANTGQIQASGDVLEVESTANLPDILTDEQREAVKWLHVEFQIALEKSINLATEKFEETKKQIEAFPFRNITPQNRAGFLIGAIEKAYSLPEGYFEHLKQKAMAEERAKREAEIDACRICDERGYRNVKSERDVHNGLMHQCTHDEEIESQFEEHNF